MSRNNEDISIFPTTSYLESFLNHIPGSQTLLLSVINAFEQAALPYALVGSLGRKCWLNHQEATKDADLLITDEYRKNLNEALTLMHGFQKYSPFPNMITLECVDCALKIDIMIATAGFDPEESCVHDAISLSFVENEFSFRLAKPEYLAWMLTSSPHDRHRRDLKRLLHSHDFNLSRLESFMTYAGDEDGLEMISKMMRVN